MFKNVLSLISFFMVIALIFMTGVGLGSGFPENGPIYWKIFEILLIANIFIWIIFAIYINKKR